jgi:hypothetical protein
MIPLRSTFTFLKLNCSASLTRASGTPMFSAKHTPRAYSRHAENWKVWSELLRKQHPFLVIWMRELWQESPDPGRIHQTSRLIFCNEKQAYIRQRRNGFGIRIRKIVCRGGCG